MRTVTLIANDEVVGAAEFVRYEVTSNGACQTYRLEIRNIILGHEMSLMSLCNQMFRVVMDNGMRGVIRFENCQVREYTAMTNPNYGDTMTIYCSAIEETLNPVPTNAKTEQWLERWERPR